MDSTPTREQVVEAWKKISSQGFGDPAEISELLIGKPKTSEMIEAERLYDQWYKNEQAKISAPEEKLRFQFEATMLYPDAGFVGSDYLDEVANEWLVQDAETAEAEGFTELAKEINSKIDLLNQQINQ